MPALASENLAYGDPDVGYGFAAVACSPQNLRLIRLESFIFTILASKKSAYE
jgi:hypothetical protein